MKYVDSNTLTELLVGVHLVEGDEYPQHVLVLEEDHAFFQLGARDPDEDSIYGYDFVVDGTELLHVPIVKTTAEELEEAIGVEAVWVRKRLILATIEIELHRDFSQYSQGQEQDWRDYRNLLRDWSESPNFPDVNFRPVLAIHDVHDQEVDYDHNDLWYE